MHDNIKALLGTWSIDEKDMESIRRFGNVILHFTADGRLNYTFVSEKKMQRALLTYRVENNVLIMAQPSAPREDRANFRITEEGKLELESLEGGTTHYVRTRMLEHLNFAF